VSDNCVYCDSPVVWATVMATTEGQRTAFRADSYGPMALTEHQQLIHTGKVCALCVDEDEAVYRYYDIEW
jgi:hypothetical protein